MIISDVFPHQWKFCLVKEAGETLVGQQRSPETTNGVAADQRQYLRVANVRDDALDLQDLTTMSFDADAREKYRLSDGDILLCEGQSRELVGRAAMYRSEPEELYFQNTLIRFRAHREILPEFALLVFRAYQHSGVFSEIAKATTNIAHLGLRRFQELPFPLPPRITQEAIIDCARDIQASIDSSLSAIQNILSTGSGFPGAARDLLILEGAAMEETEPCGHQAPLLWKQAAEIVDDESPIVYGILQPGPDVEDGSGVPYVRGQDLQDGYILQDQLRKTSPSIARRYERSSLKPGDVLLGIIRSLRVAVVPPELEGANITQGTARIRPGSGVDSDYLAHWFSSSAAQEWLRSRLRGIDMPGLNLRDVRQLPVPLRELGTQRQIAEALNEVTAALQGVTRDAQTAAHRLREMEREFTASCAFGEMAKWITQKTSGDATEELSSLILDHVKESAAKPKSRPNRSTRPANKNRRSRISLQDSIDAQGILEVLQEAKNSVSPEYLYRQLSLSDGAVDSFYAALRELTETGSVQIVRPNETDVEISVAK
ncbi:restriction endonuclease subunit S [Streptomyces europaeiscabiei]|uniref:Restriction endonuclease subunit S n=1 Tax=Streptomyces europaeiscabiei TaxID=146819 RepID=A0ABU4NK37_9ACTN|nr:restriction endonuclease subunit S [Streptomyces europaeiscabiei]MDX3544873.1 restriction endonuclease subunit S [Streptomyces europaeiscabiei]MDX3554561.1 restriction endonuclease subunit S [Streptomyces europaeiscabiei]MDX3702537.1 restriction endonuclease subunit S [Streptomyces europaeiscabiei]